MRLVPASSPVGWNWYISMSTSVAPGAPGHRHAVAGLLERGGRDAVHARAAAGGQNGQIGLNAHELAAAGVEHDRAGDPGAVLGAHADPARGLPPGPSRPLANNASRRRPTISIPVRSPRWTVRSNDWPANGFWWMRPSSRAVEEAADAGLQLLDHAWGAVHQRLRELLVVDELAAFEGVLEVERPANRRDPARRCSRPAPCACSRSCRPGPWRRGPLSGAGCCAPLAAPRAARRRRSLGSTRRR